METLPLMVLGVDEAVLGSYFVLYATIGFFEHSNIRMRNPWLGYVLSTAELHRRHHSREPAESSCNFGNMLMIWDVLFGTRRAAAISAPGALGLPCESYPRGFLALLIAPFRASPYSRQATTRTESTLLSIPPGKLSESPMQTEG